MTKQSVEQVQELHRKNWGHERWIVNKPEYCGKILHFRESTQCSIHYHNEKDETFYLLSGKLKIRYSDQDFKRESYSDGVEYRILYPGETFHVYPGLRHEIYAYEDSDLLEISTFHKEEDSIRLKG